MKLTDFKALTFDCYGTLIDWETGIWNALQPLVSEGHLKITREEALDAFGQQEKAQEEETPSLRYSTLLAVVHARLAKRWGARIYADLNDRFGAHAFCLTRSLKHCLRQECSGPPVMS